MAREVISGVVEDLSNQQHDPTQAHECTGVVEDFCNPEITATNHVFSRQENILRLQHTNMVSLTLSQHQARECVIHLNISV